MHVLWTKTHRKEFQTKLRDIKSDIPENCYDANHLKVAESEREVVRHFLI